MSKENEVFTDDLVKRLRDPDFGTETTERNLMNSAANRIEELEAKLAACEKYRDAYAEFDRIGTQAVRDLEAKLSKSEALLAKAVTCIQHIAANKITDELNRIEWDTHDTFTVLDACILSARTTLAELKGQDNE